MAAIKTSSLIDAAHRAAFDGELDAMREFVVLAYAEAARQPEGVLERETLLPTIAVAQLRAQGRL